MQTPDRFLYINEQLHTGHIQDATLELLHDSISVATSGLEQSQSIANATGKKGSGYVLSLFLGPEILSWYLRKNWRKKENYVLRCLDAAKLFRGNPVRQVDSIFSQKEAPQTRGPIDMGRIVEFWRRSKVLAEELFEAESLMKLTTLGWSMHAFVGSRRMRGALYEKVYLL